MPIPLFNSSFEKKKKNHVLLFVFLMISRENQKIANVNLVLSLFFYFHDGEAMERFSARH